MGLALGDQERATGAFWTLLRAADEEQIAVGIGADDCRGRLLVGPLEAPAPDQPPAARDVAVAEEVAVVVAAGVLSVVPALPDLIDLIRFRAYAGAPIAFAIRP